MKTTLVMSIGGSSRRISRTWPAISDAVRLRVNPIAPVAQNAHCNAQPACDEMHNVIRSPSGIATLSIASLSDRRNRNFSVPSTDFWRAAISRRGRVNSSASASRSDLGNSVISSKLRAGFCHKRFTT